METTTRVAVYCRVSTTKQEREGTSLATQEQRCRAYAAERGWSVVALESEQGSGMHRHRPGLIRLRAMVRTRQVEILLAYGPDRLARDKRLSRELGDECADHGVDLDYVTADYDDSLEGEFRRDLDGYFGAKEHALICERTMRGRLARVEGAKGGPGKPLPGRRPIYGYAWEAPDDKHRLVVREDHAAVVRRIFADFRAGRSLRAIARDLTAELVPTPSGRNPTWQPCSVRALLREAAYVGEYRALRRETVKGTGTRTDKRGKPVTWMVNRPIEQTRLLPDVAPPIIGRAVWEAVQRKLAGNGALNSRSRSRDEEALLRGRVVCSHCGGGMLASPSNGKVAYRCAARLRKLTTCPMTTVRAEVLDGPVWHHVLRFLNDPALLRRGVETVRRDDPVAADLARLEKSLAGAREKRQNLYAGVALARSADVIVALTGQADDLSADIAGWEADAEAMRREHTDWGLVEESLDDLERWHRDRFAAVGDPEGYTVEQKRAWLGWFDLRVVVRSNPSVRKRTGAALDIRRVDADWAADQPYTVEARMPLGELPPFGHAVVTDTCYRRNTRALPASRAPAPGSGAAPG